MRLRPFIALSLGAVAAGAVFACALEVAGENPAADGGTEAACIEDIASSPRHCGACNHDCGRGSCKSGVCTAYVITEGAEAPWYVNVDATHVYWTSNATGGLGAGKVQRSTKEGGGIETLADLSNSYDLVVHDGAVFVTGLDDQGLVRVRVGEGDGGVSRVSDAGRMLDVVGLGDTLFFTARGDGKEPDKVQAFGAGDGKIRDLVQLDGSVEPEGIAVDQAFVYWANRMANTIGRVRQDGGDRSDEWQRSVAPRRLTIDDDAIYFTTPTAVWRREKSSALEAKPILNADVHWGSVVVHDRWAYVAVENEGVVARVDKVDGSGRVDIATNIDHPIGIAQDETSIYFTERAAGRIWRVQK